MTKIVRGIVLISLLILVISCGDKDKPVFTQIMPTSENARLDFIGYVTNEKFELTHEMTYFSRSYVGEIEIDGKTVHQYISNNKITQFYTDENGSLLERSTENIENRIVQYGLYTKNPVEIKFWKPLLKFDKGLETRWEIQVDTTFTAFDENGKVHEIEYFDYGQAKYDGWSEVAVPYRRDEPYRVMNTFWPRTNTYYYDKATGDSLYVRRGKARQLFEPKFGAIRFMTDYVYKFKGDTAYTFRRGTWELKSKYLPGEK